MDQYPTALLAEWVLGLQTNCSDSILSTYPDILVSWSFLLRRAIILFLSTSDKCKFQVYNFTAFRQIILNLGVASGESIFENKTICVVYWTVKSYILLPNWYGRCAKKYHTSKNIACVAQGDRGLLAVSYFKWTMQTSTWRDYLTYV